MAKGAYIGIGGVAKKIKKMYIGATNYAPNLLTNGRLNSSTTGWTMNGSYTAAITSSDYLRLTATATTSSGTFPCYQAFDSSISGNTVATRKIIYACAKVRGNSGNTSFPRVYLSNYKNGATSATYSNFSSIDGLSGTSLNDGSWHTLSYHGWTYNESTGDYWEFYRIGFGINVTTTGDIMDIKEIALFNLTDIFGSGNEPDKAWCDENLTTYAEKIALPAEYSVARKIKKAYIGVGGIAKLFWIGGELKASSSISSTAAGKCAEKAGAAVTDYAVFAGGRSGSVISSSVHAYDSEGTYTGTTALPIELEGLAGASFCGYAFFAGGTYSSGSSAAQSHAVTYDNSLTRQTRTSLSKGRTSLAGAANKNYVLFAGGYGASSTHSDVVDTYNTSFTKGTAPALSNARRNLAGSSVGNYTLFAGGEDDSSAYSTVDTYTTSLTKSTADNLSPAYSEPLGIANENYAFFCDKGKSTTTVQVYNASLTRSTVSLGMLRSGKAVATLGEFALFAGGAYNSSEMRTYIDAFDSSLTKKTDLSLKTGRWHLSGAATETFAVFVGGYTGSTISSSMTDAMDLFYLE